MRSRCGGQQQPSAITRQGRTDASRPAPRKTPEDRRNFFPLSTSVPFFGNEIAGSRIIPARTINVGKIVLRRLYFTRQATSLLKFAKATSNPELAAVLVQKAADLKEQTEAQKQSSEDKSP